MRVNVKNENGKLKAVSEMGEFPMLHSYIRNDIIVTDEGYRHGDDCVEYAVGSKRVGVVVAVKVDDEIFFGWSKVKEPDVFNPHLGIKIATGKALTRPMLGPDDFKYVEWDGHLDAYDALLEVYNRAQRYLVHH